MAVVTMSVYRVIGMLWFVFSFSYFIPGYLSVFVYGVIVMLWFVLSSG